ncbi:MAG: hypothetical protein ACYCV7_09035 [Acidimicrobiales bacterium]
MTRPTICRTVFQVEVFSEAPLPPDGGDMDPFNLAQINYAICEGDCIGNVEEATSEAVPDGEVEAHPLRIGNDGSFFGSLDGC